MYLCTEAAINDHKTISRLYWKQEFWSFLSPFLPLHIFVVSIRSLTVHVAPLYCVKHK